MPNALRNWICVMALSGFPIAMGQQAEKTHSDERTTFEYHVNPLVDLYNQVRATAMSRAPVEPSPELAEAVVAARAVAEKLGPNVLAWEPLDQRLIDCRNAADLVAAFTDMPETVTLRGGREISVRAEAVRLAEALARAEPSFRDGAWPKREAAIRAALETINQDFTPRAGECLAYMLDKLGMRDPRRAVPVYLCHDVAWPGAYTIGRPGGGGMVFISVTDKDHAGTLLYETILHEATHALELASPDAPSVFRTLREELVAAGYGPRDRELRDVPHTLMFIQAGETVRRILAPGHEHYGVATGLYGRLGRIAEIERVIWVDYLDGGLSREAAIERIMKELTRG